MNASPQQRHRPPPTPGSIEPTGAAFLRCAQSFRLGVGSKLQLPLLPKQRLHSGAVELVWSGQIDQLAVVVDQRRHSHCVNPARLVVHPESIVL